MLKKPKQISDESPALNRMRVPVVSRQRNAEWPMPLVIFDVSCLAHRAKWTTSPLQHKGKPTGVLFGVMNQINKIRRLFPSNSALVFAWDSPFSLRKEVYPNYKEARKKTITPEELAMKEEFFQQMNILRPQVMEPMGFAHHVGAKGYEADDVIASLVEWGHRKSKIGQIWIVSSDDDLFQLLDRATLYRPHKERNYGMVDLYHEHAVTPGEWAKVTAIAGTHNGVAGVYGVGLKTAAAYVAGERVSPSKVRAIETAESCGLIERNLELIRLPYKGQRLEPVGFAPAPFKLEEESLDYLRDEFGFNFRLEEWT
jgi:5'-3' exonuclease